MKGFDDDKMLNYWLIMSDLVKSLEPSLLGLFSMKNGPKNFYTSVKCILIVHRYLPLNTEKYCLSGKVNVYNILQFCAYKTACPHRWSWLKADSVLES